MFGGWIGFSSQQLRDVLNDLDNVGLLTVIKNRMYLEYTRDKVMLTDCFLRCLENVLLVEDFSKQGSVTNETTKRPSLTRMEKTILREFEREYASYHLLVGPQDEVAIRSLLEKGLLLFRLVDGFIPVVLLNRMALRRRSSRSKGTTWKRFFLASLEEGLPDLLYTFERLHYVMTVKNDDPKALGHQMSRLGEQKLYEAKVMRRYSLRFGRIEAYFSLSFHGKVRRVLEVLMSDWTELF